MLFEVYLGLGSNLGDRAVDIDRGLQLLGQLSKNLASSSVYETSPEGFLSQPPFLNAACRLWTPLDPFELMASVREIEAAVGRRRSFVNGPRALDIDILMHGRAVIDVPGLKVPHPRMAERAFVLVPLAEIAPGLRHPVLKETIDSLLTRLSVREGAVRRVATSP